MQKWTCPIKRLRLYRDSPAKPEEFTSLVWAHHNDVPRLHAFEALDRGSVVAELLTGSRLRLVKAQGGEAALLRMMLPSLILLCPFCPFRQNVL
jgi:hypothetical protein